MGRQEIANRFDEILSSSKALGILGRTGRPTQIGPYVAQTFSWGSRGATDGEGVLVFKLDGSGKIAHEWVVVDAAA